MDSGNLVYGIFPNATLYPGFLLQAPQFLGFLQLVCLHCKKKGIVTGLDAKEYISCMDATTKFLERGETNACLPIEGKDVAIPLLISGNLDPDLHGHRLTDCQVSKVGWWRQALLVNNTVISETVLDSRAAAVGTSAGHGIIGTCDGYVYMWELSTGIILGNLHYFKGSAVSCIATDDSSSGAFAVAGDCRLRVYLHSQRVSTNQQGNKLFYKIY